MFNYNIKKIIIILASTMIISFSVAAIIFFASGGINKSSMSIKPKDSQSYSINEQKANKVKDITEIYVNNSFPDINIKVENTDEIKTHLYGNITSTFMPKLETKIEGNKLIIDSAKNSMSYSIFSGNLNLDITIPSSYSSSVKVSSSSGNISTLSPLKLNKFNLNLSSGDTHIKDLTSEDLVIHSSSGTITEDKIVSKNISFESASGDIKLKNLTTENLTISSSSGVISGDTIVSKNALLNSTSGDVNFTNFKGDINQRTSSGKVMIVYSEFNNNIKLSSTSGDITLKLPKNAQFRLNSKTTSGDINCDFPINLQEKSKKNNLLIGTVGSDKNSIEVTASSGDVNITSN